MGRPGKQRGSWQSWPLSLPHTNCTMEPLQIEGVPSILPCPQISTNSLQSHCTPIDLNVQQESNHIYKETGMGR
jgi:hypothetical protein